MFTIISDIDDVVRDFRRNIIASMNLFHHGDDWGEYNYNNPKLREFFDWYREKPYFYHLYQSSHPNTEMINLLNRLMYRNNQMNLFFLSSNTYKMGQVLTNQFLFEHFREQYISSNIYYVDRWFNKINHVKHNTGIYGIDKLNTIFIDDRPDSCLSFIQDGRLAFWYTKYLTPDSISVWEKEIPLSKELPRGDTQQFEMFLKEKIGGIHV